MFKILLPLFKIFFILFKLLGKIIFKTILFPFYKLYLKTKNKIQEKKAAGASPLALLTHKNIVHFVIIAAGLIIFVNNLVTKSTLAEELGRGSMIFTLAKRDEFSEIKDEALVVVSAEDKVAATEKQPAENKICDTPTSTPASVFEMVLRQGAQLSASQETWQNLLAAQNNPITAGTLIKPSSPETEGALPERDGIINYTVAAGDTAASIAKKFGVSVNTILWENKLSANSLLRPGQILSILPTSGISHIVTKKDTLDSIAKKYAVEAARLLSLNHLASAADLKVGQKIIVPGARPIVPVQPRTTQSVASVFSQAPSTSGGTRPGGLIWPTVSRKITQYYTWRHHGLDIGSKVGLPIYAALDGTVTKAGWGTGYGYHVILDHGGGKKTLYGHMSKIYVTKGQEVRQGEAIGAIGSTGWSTGPNLHFEFIINGSKVNPLTYL